MKTNLLKAFAILVLSQLPIMGNAQAPSLGSASDFVIFTSIGAVTNTGISQITGNVGTNSGSITGFGNVNGQMLSGNGVTLQCAADLLTAYNELDTMTADFFPSVLLGNGDTLIAGVYYVSASATLNGNLYLDAEGDANAVFVMQVEGTLGTSSNSEVVLLNGAQACNVFWKVEGAVSMAAGTRMKGNVIANNAAITMNSNDTLEGRAFSTAGQITLDGVMAFTPVGCGSPLLTGPAAPPLGTAACYAVFSSDGPVMNTGITNLTGDVGTNVGLTTGYDTLLVNGTVHPIPDVSTSAAAADLLNAYTILNGIAYDIELLYPAQFGNNLVLTPHTYWLNGATTFTDSLYLNAMGDSNAVFVIRINGALSTSTYAKVILMNGAQAEHVYWQVDGAIDINDYSEMKGTFVGNNGAIDLNIGVSLDGRALTTTGAVNTAAITVVMPAGCSAFNAPIVINEPLSDTVCLGDTAQFIVSASGVGLSYQWRRGNVDLIDTGNISGSSTDTLTIFPVAMADTSMDYNVIISNSFSVSDTSINVSLVLSAATAITTAPLNQTACDGDSVSFSVSATGTNLTYQWRKGTVNIMNGGPISGANSATLTINPVDVLYAATDYNVIVSGECAPADTSANVSLIINTAPSITTAPSNQTACAGSSVSFTVVASGSGLSYQWRKGTVNIVNGGTTSGATSATLTINPVGAIDAAANYNVVVSGACTPPVTSADVSLVVNDVPTITTAPSNQTACDGGSVSFTVVASGTGLTYQWRKGLMNISNGGAISGATSATLTINPVNVLDAAPNYNVVVSGTCSPAANSANVSLTVDTEPTITSAPSNQTACAGSSVSFTVAATGTGLSYQWRKGTVNIANGGTTSGATSATLTINPVGVIDAAANYNVVISGACTPSATSADVSLVVNDVPTITTAPSNQTVCDGNSVSFAVVASGTGLTYQWRKGTVNISNGGAVSGATSATLTINPVNALDAAPNYNVVVSGTCAPVATSADVSLIVDTVPVITTAPSSQTVCDGNTVNFTVAATGTGLTYQWRKGTVNIVNGGTTSGANSATLTINPVAVIDAATNYNVVVSGTCTPAATSADVALTVESSAVIVTDPMDQTYCEGNEVSFSVSATGSNLTYQWRRGLVNLSNGGTISGANTATLTFSPIVPSDSATDYNVVVSGTGTCATTAVSANAELTVQLAPVYTLEPTDQTVCEGNSVSFSADGYGTGISFQWKIGETDLVNGGNISGAQSKILTINPVTLADTSVEYNIVINGTCTPNNSDLVTLNVLTSPEILIHPTHQSAYTGSEVKFFVKASGDGLVYQWRKGNVDLTNGGNISGVNTDTLTINPLAMSDTATDYNVVIMGACSPEVASRNAALKAVYPLGVEASKALAANVVNVYPNPFRNSLVMIIDASSEINHCDLIVFNALGKAVIRQTIDKRATTVDASHLAAGLYFYQVIDQGKTIQSGKLISQ